MGNNRITAEEFETCLMKGKNFNAFCEERKKENPLHQNDDIKQDIIDDLSCYIFCCQASEININDESILQRIFKIVGESIKQDCPHLTGLINFIKEDGKVSNITTGTNKSLINIFDELYAIDDEAFLAYAKGFQSLLAKKIPQHDLYYFFAGASVSCSIDGNKVILTLSIPVMHEQEFKSYKEQFNTQIKDYFMEYLSKVLQLDKGFLKKFYTIKCRGSVDEEEAKQRHNVIKDHTPDIKKMIGKQQDMFEDSRYHNLHDLVVHDGNTRAIKLLNQLKDCILFNSGTTKHVFIYGDADTGKTFMVRKLLEKIQTFLPNYRIKEISGSELKTHYAKSAKSGIINADWQHFHDMKEVYENSQLLIISHIEDFTSGKTAHIWLNKLLEQKQCIVISDKDPHKLTDIFYHKRGALSEAEKADNVPQFNPIIKTLESFDNEKVHAPDKKTRKRILSALLKEKNIKLEDTLIGYISQCVSQTHLYASLVGSLGRDPKVTDGSFTKEDALDLMKEKMIFNGRRKLEDLQKRVQEYIEKEELNLSKDMDKKFVAYLAQKIPKSTEGYTKKFLSIEEIAVYLGVTKDTVNNYTKQMSSYNGILSRLEKYVTHCIETRSWIDMFFGDDQNKDT